MLLFREKKEKKMHCLMHYFEEFLNETHTIKQIVKACIFGTYYVYTLRGRGLIVIQGKQLHIKLLN